MSNAAIINSPKACFMYFISYKRMKKTEGYSIFVVYYLLSNEL